MIRPIGSETVTQGMRVKVEPFYMAEHSACEEGHYLFGYRVTITNESGSRARLCSRHWVIVDAEGERREVHGHGVVGETPDLEVDEGFQYVSFCPLTTPWGTMEGTYLFEREDGRLLEARIDRFYLVAPQPQASTLA
jgi:ApaG protein